jgi:glutamate formiminotransferase
MEGTAVSWQSRKKPLTALSTLEAEHIACSDAIRETKWLLQLAKDVDFHTTDESKTAVEKTTAAEKTTGAMGAVTLYCDNQGAILRIVSGTSKASTKHIDARFHNSRHAHASGIINCTCIPTNENTVDICTKALAAPRHRFLVDKLVKKDVGLL